MVSMRFFAGEPRYIRKARAYLQDARMAMLEHSIAAEHYQASAEMYAERARRLEEEIASWEATRHPAAAASPQLPETSSAAPAIIGAGRAEGAKPQVHKGSAAVGIVRAA